MRQDLNKQLCEHERYGSKRCFKERRHDKTFTYRDEDGDDARLHESMKFRYGYDTKSFSENLSPLRGQVRKAVGRPWNKFYSELCEVFDKRSVINQHILEHLRDFICTKVYDKNGVLFVSRGYGPDEALYGSGIEIFVDPRDGIIKKNPKYKSYKEYNREYSRRHKEEELATFRKLDDDNVLRLINGVWFHFKMSNAPYGHYEIVWSSYTHVSNKRHMSRYLTGSSAYDEFTQENVRSTPEFAPKRYHHSKRTASKKLLKRAGLRS